MNELPTVGTSVSFITRGRGIERHGVGIVQEIKETARGAWIVITMEDGKVAKARAGLVKAV